MLPCLDKMGTLARLGPLNLVRVGLYRLALRAGIHPVQRIAAQPAEGMFFAGPQARDTPAPRADRPGPEIRYFGRSIPVSDPPDWFRGPDSLGAADANRPWWRIPDFDPAVGDIKAVWEASRFDWVLPLAQHTASGDALALARLNDWISDWARSNQPYLGTNWKCGQETSIRVMHLAAAALMMTPDGRPPLTDALRDLVRQHLQRIAPTIGYAIGQANNHGTSEGAALFIGGLWLDDAAGRVWAATGRRWLEDRARRLIQTDGTFSQYSVNYHRMMLDSYSLATVWAARCGVPALSVTSIARLRAATLWLAQMTDPDTGDAPVIGANDGAHLLRLTDANYRDFRPSVHLASLLFDGRRRYGPGPWDAQPAWLGVSSAALDAAPLASQSFNDGGFHILRAGTAVTYLRYPQFAFRPSQADALHCDLWVAGRNILRDGGSYSYNAADAVDLNCTAAHNTVQFDGRDQMPRLSRFLFGSWLRARDVALVGDGRAAAGYTDAAGVTHDRRIHLTATGLTVTDTIARFRTATLRWRLDVDDWQLDGPVLRGDGITLTITAPHADIRLTQGWESRYYLQKTRVPVLEVTTTHPGTITTKVSF